MRTKGANIESRLYAVILKWGFLVSILGSNRIKISSVFSVGSRLELVLKCPRTIYSINLQIDMYIN
jgi:hypothetical protein